MATPLPSSMYRRVYLRVFRWTVETRERAETIWASSEFGWVLIGVFALLYLFWLSHTPPPGEAVATLGVLAAVIAFRKELGGVEKFLCAIFLILFLLMEFKSIDKDRGNHDAQEAQNLEKQADSFKEVLKNQQTGFKRTLDQEQDHFESTLASLIQSQDSERRQFTALVKQGRDIFAHQQELAESLTEQLVPASDSTPNNSCTEHPNDPDDLLLFIGTNTYVTHTFPHTVLKINNDDVLKLNRTTEGQISIITDLRGRDDRIVARLSDNGIVVNESNKLQVKKDSNAILIEDQYGNEVLNARYINKRAFRIDGLLFYHGVPIKLSEPFPTGPHVTELCSRYNSIDIHVNVPLGNSR